MTTCYPWGPLKVHNGWMVISFYPLKVVHNNCSRGIFLIAIMGVGISETTAYMNFTIFFYSYRQIQITGIFCTIVETLIITTLKSIVRQIFSAVWRGLNRRNLCVNWMKNGAATAAPLEHKCIIFTLIVYYLKMNVTKEWNMPS